MPATAKLLVDGELVSPNQKPARNRKKKLVSVAPVRVEQELVPKPFEEIEKGGMFKVKNIRTGLISLESFEKLSPGTAYVPSEEKRGSVRMFDKKYIVYVLPPPLPPLDQTPKKEE
jgi:hypothetical protein